MIWCVVAAASLVAGIIQSVTGFGSVVFLMMVLPFYFDMIDAPALAIVINQLFCMALCWKYRRHIRWRLALPPTIAFGLTNLLTLLFVGGLDMQVLVIVLGVFLILLAVYFLIFARRVKMTPKPAAGITCGALCGVSAGLFAIGGPPMALYFVAAAEDHATYLACMQLLFAITGMTGETAPTIETDLGSVQCVQLGLCGVELLGLGFQIVVIGILCALTGQAVGNNAVYLGLCEGARLLLLSGCSGNGFLIYSFTHGVIPFPAYSVAVYGSIHPHPHKRGDRLSKALLKKIAVCKSALTALRVAEGTGGGPSPCQTLRK